MPYMRTTIEQRNSDNNDVSKRDIPSFIEPLPPLISNPFMRPKPVKGTNLLELFEEDSECEEPELVQVYLRMKPSDVPSTLYEVRSDQCLVTSMDTATAGHGRRTQHNVNKMYTFSRIFGADTSQKEIFENVVKDNLRKLPDGQSYTLLTYGASGSGKTYTLMGTVASPGLVPRSLEYLFQVVEAAQQPVYKPSEGGAEQLSPVLQEYELQWVKKVRHVSAPLRDKYRRMSAQLRADCSTVDLSTRTQHYVWVSFVEIYNEAVYDLLVTSDRRSASKLRIREDASGQVFVKGATQAFVRSGSEAYDVLVAGKHNLQVAATGVHAHSSRSHCIFTITLLTHNEAGNVRISTVRLCDLAGAERACRTGALGARLAESRAINSSLHVLERCLHMLRRRQKAPGTNLVPYRESKLTRLLGAGLSGRGGEAVCMVVTLNPDPAYSHETRHVLQLAAVARDIQVNSTIAETEVTFDSVQDSTIATSAEVMKLRADNERLHYELVQAQSRNKQLLLSMEERQQASAATMRELVEEAKDMTRQYYEAELRAVEERARTEIEDLTEEYESKLRGINTPSKMGTPSKSLHNMVARLQTEITILEEKLAAERLARERVEEEMQHLRACIEERDQEKSADDNATDVNRDILLLSDEEQDSDDEMNQSLEPSFRNEKLKTPKKSIEADNKTYVSENDSDDDTILDSTAKKSFVLDKSSKDSLDDDTLNDTSRKSSLIHQQESTEEQFKSCAENSTYTSDKGSTTSNFADESVENSNNETDYVKEVSFAKPADLKRGTYMVKESDIKDFNDSADSGCNISKTNKDSNDDSLINDKSIDADKVNVSFEGKSVGNISKTLLSKFKHSTVSSQKSNESLALFEQFEKDVDNKNNKLEKQPSEVFTNIKILKEKRTYFDDDNKLNNPGEPEMVTRTVVNEPACVENKKSDLVGGTDKVDVTGETLIKDDVVKKGRTYFDDHQAPSEKHVLEPENLLKKVKIERISEVIVDESPNFTTDFGNIKILKEKRTYFDNIDKNIENTKLMDVINNSNTPSVRSPSIVKEEIPNDYEPTTIKILLGDSRTSNVNAASVIKHKLISKVHESLDIFDEVSSPKCVDNPVDNVDELRKSIGNIILTEDSTTRDIDKNNRTEKDTKVDTFKSPKTHEMHKPAEKYDTIPEILLSQSKNMHNSNNTDVDFENLYKDVSTSRATEFDLLVTQDFNNTDVIEDRSSRAEKRASNLKHDNSSHSELEVKEQGDTSTETENKRKNPGSILDFAKEAKDKRNDSNENIKTVKYNLRHKTESDEKDNEQKAAEIKTKRSLRLRRRKNFSEDDESADDKTSKLKDIVNLQKEFSDVIMDIPVAEKVVKDIPSPEKKQGEEENVAPLYSQSCPSKSVTRSRRKLFTPRAEPLDESPPSGGSCERVRVPRPSYHRGRARRKL
ncbi:hypothetical protein JYU34_017322 [Plutella xylostella]|uniref:Kinesin motor domain-containing protein n=1 Tax=Plutella xylostella TaxID=51655 RepID=A0ABQ7Q0Y0_PLUXY|nr:hypothetical protein JYU34_017322 [Plutella xylostella]